MRRRRFLQWLGGWAASARAQDSATSSNSSATAFQVRSRDLIAELSDRAAILRLKLGPKLTDVPFRACTVLAGCRVDGVITSRAVKGGAEFVRRIVHERTGERCRLTDRFEPAAASVRWTIEIESDGPPWTTPIETQTALLNSAKAKFWTAWDNPPGAAAGWNDPLAPVRFVTASYRYGTASIRDSRSAPAFCIPICTTIDDATGVGLSIIQSPEDLLLDMELHTSEAGDLTLVRKNHRIGGARPLSFHVDLVCHEPDWRAGLGWMAERYARFFEPANPRAYELDGCGAYSAHSGGLDRVKYTTMAFRVNWNAHFDFAYEGMFAPPLGPGETWTSWYGETTSLTRMAAYDARMEEAGFHVLEYFCTTDAGNFVEAKAPPRKAKLDKDLWRDPNDFIHYAIPDAVVREPDGGIRFSNWFRSVNVDPGERVWQEILLEQARRLVQHLPASSGICIDRMDWLATYNPHRDDGVSWIEGRPARSLLVSWKDLLSKLGPVFHGANKCIYGNPGTKRIDANEHLDGFYDEFADFPNVLNMAAILGVLRPVVAWTRNLSVLRPDPDAYFQRHLHLGVFPTAPLPGNDHTILPDSWADLYYLDYGPLLDALSGKRWVLRANPIYVVRARAKANIFEIPGGFAIPVTFGGAETDVELVVNDLPPLPGAQAYVSKVRHPGSAVWAPVNTTTTGNALHFDCPLRRGCAMATVLHSWIESDTGASKKAELRTVVKDAVIHYTLDGSLPTTTSPVYSQPLHIERPATLKMIVTVGGRKFGRMLWRRVG